MKNRILLAIAVCAVVTLSFTLIVKQKESKSEVRSQTAETGFMLEDKL